MFRSGSAELGTSIARRLEAGTELDFYSTNFVLPIISIYILSAVAFFSELPYIHRSTRAISLFKIDRWFLNVRVSIFSRCFNSPISTPFRVLRRRLRANRPLSVIRSVCAASSRIAYLLPTRYCFRTKHLFTIRDLIDKFEMHETWLCYDPWERWQRVNLLVM